MKTSYTPSALPVKRRSMGSKLQDMIDVPNKGSVEDEFRCLLEAADMQLKQLASKDHRAGS